MADAYEEFSSDCYDRISSDNSSFNVENCSAAENLQYKEPRSSFSSAEKQKSRSEESNSPSN